MSKWMYDYLLSYTFNNPKYLTPCTGVIEYSTTIEITTFDEVRAAKEFILERLEKGSTNLGIYNIVLLGRNKH